MNNGNQQFGGTSSNRVRRNSLEGIFDELESVIGDINSFFHNFCERMRRVTTETVSSGANSNETAISPEARENWETKRARTEQRIRDHVDMLADAWLRLEAEQRILLQMKEGLAVDLTSRSEKSTAGSAGSSRHCIPGSSTLPQLRQSAVDDFETLRQEIQFSRPLNSVK